jgi:hypothetical protein
MENPSIKKAAHYAFVLRFEVISLSLIGTSERCPA